jgi:CubicO group peptidase (beta-lactamase class C family)
MLTLFLILPLSLPAEEPVDLSAKAKSYHRSQQSPTEGVIYAEIREGKKNFGQAGVMGKDRPEVSPQTLFEIGSITKTFTGTLLADAVLQKKANLEDPVSKFLPPEQLENLAEDSPLRTITLAQLSTHRSGLPRLPGDLFEGSNPGDPYAHYTVEKLWSYLARMKKSVLEKPGEMSYSNLGVGLLGAILERIWEVPYEELVSEKIFKPLGMKNSYVQRRAGSIPKEAEPLFATGHSRGRPASHWCIDALCGAGAIVSSAEDMLRYAEAHLSDDTPEDLKKAIQLATRVQTGNMGLGWFVKGSKISHGGGTGGFRTKLEIDLELKTAWLELKNSTGRRVSFSSTGDFSPVEGYWRTELETPRRTLPILMRIRKDGSIYSHSLSQGARGIPGANASYQNDSLKVEFPEINSQLTVALKDGELVGTWRQGKKFPIVYRKIEVLPETLFNVLRERVSGDVSEVAGFWSGYLGGKEGLFVVLEIEPIEDTGEVRLYSPDQSDAAIVVHRFTIEGKSISLEAKSIHASYEAELKSEEEISGIWNQLSLIPLTLKWSKERPERAGKD